MALSLAIKTNESLELDECVEWADKQVNRDEFDSLIDSAPAVKKLANNRRFLAEHVNERLSQYQRKDLGDAGDTSFLLARRTRLWIRANVWIPPALLPMNTLLRANVAAYLIPHDHRFSFVTVGYLGSGYKTTIFEYDSGAVHGHVGEQVNLRFLEKTQLQQGKVMVYRAGKDVHCQAHPEELSISLNLIVFDSDYRDQYTFDVKRSLITGRAQDFRQAQRLMCQIAAKLGNGRTINLLEETARRHDDEEVRLGAFEAWSQLDRDQAARVWETAVSDPHTLVRNRAIEQLKSLAYVRKSE